MLQRFLHFTAQILILACVLFMFASINGWCIGALGTLAFVLRLGIFGSITHLLFHFCFPQQRMFSFSEPNYTHTPDKKVA